MKGFPAPYTGIVKKCNLWLSTFLKSSFPKRIWPLVSSSTATKNYRAQVIRDAVIFRTQTCECTCKRVSTAPPQVQKKEIEKAAASGEVCSLRVSRVCSFRAISFLGLLPVLLLMFCGQELNRVVTF